MRRHLTRTATTAIVSAASLSVFAAPAQALAAPTFSTIDASTPGHARVTVTAPDSAYVAAWLRSVNQGIDVGAPVLVPVSEGVASFDFETWGLATGVVQARPCSGATTDTCGAYVSSGWFTATDVKPVIAFPADDTIGPGQPYIVDAVDPDGGGLLTADWFGTRSTLTPGGSTDVALPIDAYGAVRIDRCSTVVPSLCRATGIQRTVWVNRKFSYQVTNHNLGQVNPGLGTKLRPLISTDEGSSYTFDWHVEDAVSHEQVPGLSGSTTGLNPDGPGGVQPEVDVSGLNVDKAYTLIGALSWSLPDYGDFVTAPLHFSFVVDTVAPGSPTLSTSRATVYPAQDGYADKVTLTVGKQQGAGNVVLVKVSNSAGEVVREFRSSRDDATVAFPWSGTDGSGHRVPAGGYTIKATVTDRAGNTSTPAMGTVTVIRQRLASRTFNHTYSARSVLTKKWVGACSTLASPSKRGWSGSLGFYSNSKCSRTVDASVVDGLFVARVPAAFAYRNLTISTYGGAAREANRSVAYVLYRRRDGDFSSPGLMLPGVGTHAGPTVGGARYVYPDRSIGWDVVNIKGSRYDVKSFTVKLDYTVLVPE